MKIEFSPPFVDDDVIKAVVDTLKSGWITTGPKVLQFEKRIKEMTDAEAVVCVNSWTSGAILTLKWFGITEGDEVIIPAYTYSATALAVLHCGAKPVMVDIGDDLTINTLKIEAAITSKTKLIMPVDIGGLPCNYQLIMDIVHKKEIVNLFKPNSKKQKSLGRILIASDAAHSFGAQYKNQLSGKICDITIFSFHAVKNITTAEGGAVCLNLPLPFNNKTEYDFLKLYTLNGQSKDGYSKIMSGGWKYDILFHGLKINLPDLCAAVGLAQIEKYNNYLLPERERVAYVYNSFFEKYTQFELPILKDENRKSCFHLYPLRIKNITEIQRDLIIKELANRKIAVNVHFIPLPMLTLFKKLGYSIKDYPNSYDCYSREISLPIYPQLDNDKIKYICNSILDIYNSIVSNDKNI